MPWFERDLTIERPATVLERLWNEVYKGKRFLKLYFPDHYSDKVQVSVALQMTGTEGICEGFNYKVQLITYMGTVDLKDWVGKSMGVGFAHDNGEERHICGFVRSVKQLTPDNSCVLYEVEIVDLLTLLKQRKTWRIFQDKGVAEITQQILGEHQQINSQIGQAFKLSYGEHFHLSYPKRNFTLQAGESDHDFLTRLWRQEGIMWHFSHEHLDDGENAQPTHTLHLKNTYWAFQPGESPVIRYHNDARVLSQDTVTHWHAWRQLGTRRVSRRHHEYKINNTRQAYNTNNIVQGPEAEWFAQWTFADHQHDPSKFSETWAHLKDQTEILAQHHTYTSKGFRGQGHVRAMMAGTTFELTHHDSFRHIKHPKQEDREFLITSLSMYARNNLNLETYQLGSMYPEWRDQGQGEGEAYTAPDEAPLYINRFECVRKHITVIPRYDHSMVPNIGPMTAKVVTRNDAEVDVDDMGRILVKFAFTRPEDHQGDDFDPHIDELNRSDTQGREWTARIRVVQPWAHGQYGTAFYPRKGEEVLVQFINNHPDNPIVVGSVHNDYLKNTSFHGKSRVERDLVSGIRSKEHEDRRHNHLLFDDTNKQISTQLHSDHAYSQLSQGYLTTPRTDPNATQPRGEGFELRTDESGAIRTAKGMLISAFEQLKASGEQLSRDETLALMEESLSLFKQLGQVASQAQGLPSDTAPHGELSTQLKNWENGSNTAPNTTGGGAPIITLSAPAGLIQNTPETIATQAGKNIDSIALQHHQFTSGKNTILNAGHGISAFAHTQDLKTIAHQGQWIAQAQHNDMRLDAANNTKITAGQDINVSAQGEITLVAGDGTFMKLGGGKLTLGTSGSATIHAASHSMTGPKTLTPEAVSMPKLELTPSEEKRYSQQLSLLDTIGKTPDSIDPLLSVPYRITSQDGILLAQSHTNDAGNTARVYTEQAEEINLYVGDGDREINIDAKHHIVPSNNGEAA